jgi:tRNA modification GTPase
MNDDTIIAISTPFGYGGIGIIRLSGQDALSIAKKIFHPKNSTKSLKPKQIIFGKLYDFEQKRYYESGMMVYFRSPHSYTRENVVEINCHGSPLLLEETVRLGIKAGARHAHPGEFTQRAFLNGRIDMVQAEAVNDLIFASSLEQAHLSYRQVSGSLSTAILDLRRQIIHIASQIEASLEFPEDNVHISPKIIRNTIIRTEKKVRSLIASYDLGKTLRAGIQIAITGTTNVGKSTLFNALLKSRRAIVTPYPGTTRDYLREQIFLQGTQFTLIDMAGMDIPKNPIEKEGIRRGEKIVAESSGILLLLDGSRKENRQDLDLIQKYKGRRTIIAINKIDLPQKIDMRRIRKAAADCPVLQISALKKISLDRLKKILCQKFSHKHSGKQEAILHVRQKFILEEIDIALQKTLAVLDQGQPEEFAAEEIRQSLPLLGRLTGEIHSDDVINDIFSRFCIGK